MNRPQRPRAEAAFRRLFETETTRRRVLPVQSRPNRRTLLADSARGSCPARFLVPRGTGLTACRRLSRRHAHERDAYRRPGRAQAPHLVRDSAPPLVRSASGAVELAFVQGLSRLSRLSRFSGTAGISGSWSPRAARISGGSADTASSASAARACRRSDRACSCCLAGHAWTHPSVRELAGVVQCGHRHGARDCAPAACGLPRERGQSSPGARVG